MSHTTTIKSVALVSKSAIQAAVRDLKAQGIKCELLENAVPRAYYTNQAGMSDKADMVLKLDDSPYDVGLYKEGGKYEARTDLFAGQVANILGVPRSSDDTSVEQAALGKFFQAYANRAVEEQAIAQGYMVNQTKQTDGTIVMTLSNAA